MTFIPGQKVIIKNFMINGSRLDIIGEIIKFHNRTGKYEVSINTCSVFLEPEKLIDYNIWKPEK